MNLTSVQTLRIVGNLDMTRGKLQKMILPLLDCYRAIKNITEKKKEDIGSGPGS